MFSQFEGTKRPSEIIHRLNDVVSDAERSRQQVRVYEALMEQKEEDIADKDQLISKLQKRNAALSEMLQGQHVGEGERRSSNASSSSTGNAQHKDVSFTHSFSL